MRFPILIAMLLMLSGSLMLSGGCASGSGTSDAVVGPGARCPLGRNTDAMFCAEIVRYARNPSTGACCRYESLCASPAGWKTYTRKSSCEAAGEASE